MELNFTNTSNSSGACTPVQNILVDLGSLTSYTSVKLLFTFIYTFIFVLGIGGNTFVLVAVYRYRSLQSVRNIFIVNLSISDIFVCSLSLPISAHVALNVVWIFGSVTCIIVPTIQGTSVFISTFTLACIAIDRYILLTHINWRPITKAQTLGMICFVWCFAIVLSSPIGIYSRLGKHDNLCGEFCVEQKWDPQTRRLYGAALLVLQFVMPFSIIAFCYACIIQKVNESMSIRKRMGTSNQNGTTATITSQEEGTRSVSAKMLKFRRTFARRARLDEAGRKGGADTSGGPTATHRNSTSDRRHRSNKMQIGMVLMFGLSAFPQIIFNVLRDLDKLPAYVQAQSHFFTLIVHSIMMTTTVWNPFLYGFMNTNFRAAFVDMTSMCRQGDCRASLNVRPHGMNTTDGASCTVLRVKPDNATTDPHRPHPENASEVLL